jgi:hypothetical protein
MTAFDLIDSIFSRPQHGPGNARRITRDQLNYLRDLIGQDPESGKVRNGAPGSLVWTPSGRHKYVVTEDLAGAKHTLTKLSNIEASGMGNLF